MNSPEFKGELLKKARLYRSLTLKDLAEQVGVDITKQALSQYENGTSKPSHPNILALSKTLGFPFGYFFTQPHYTVKPSEAAYFRSLMTTNKKDRTAQTVRLEFIAQIYKTLSDYIDFPSIKLPKVTFADHCDDFEHENELITEIEHIAKEVRKEWFLGKEPIKDLRYILEEHGIIITCNPLHVSKIDAFSQRVMTGEYGVWFVVISKENTSLVRARFDMAHELGHILLHPWSEDLENISREEFKLRERQANMFAGAFLLPQETFGRDVSLYPTDLNYYRQLKAKWNVSIMAMVYRTRQLEIISANQYQYLMKQMSKAGWRTYGEPDDVPYSPQSTLLQSAVDLLFSSGELTPNQFLSVLSSRGIILEPNEIEDLLCLDRGAIKLEEPSNIIRLKIKSRVDSMADDKEP